jgi:hypothetical protein
MALERTWADALTARRQPTLAPPGDQGSVATTAFTFRSAPASFQA